MVYLIFPLIQIWTEMAQNSNASAVMPFSHHHPSTLLRWNNVTLACLYKSAVAYGTTSVITINYK